MSRLTAKSDLIQTSTEQCATLWTLINGMTESERGADINPDERDKKRAD